MSKEPKRNMYVGHRYVPLVVGEWDKTETYEGLSIVTNKGTSYTSKKRVPKGIDILNEEYWVVTGNYNAQIEEYRKDVRNIEEHFDSKSDITYVDGEIERLDQKDENITEQLAQTNTLTTHNQLDLLSRGVNALYPPEGFTACVGDGIADDGPALNALIDAFPIVVLPPAIYRTTITIQLKQRWKALVGNVDVSRNENNVATILYDGEVNNHLATVVVGNNGVDAEPSIDGSGLLLQNLVVDSNNKAGFGVYGTYLTNDSKVDSVTALNSLEYNMYFARAWYTTLTDLIVLSGRNNGIALGMPLEYLDGQKVDWTTKNALELNNVKVDNIRSHSNGTFFSVDNQGLYTPKNVEYRRRGYGIGAGIGNGFRLNHFTSEKNGGTNLYVYTAGQPQKTITDGYLEKPNLNSRLDTSSTMANMIIEHTSGVHTSYEIKNIYMAYDSGGIYHTGGNRRVWLKHVHQPRFLKSLDGLDSIDLYGIVLKENVSFNAGYGNTLENLGELVVYQTINTKSSFEIPLMPDHRWLLIEFRSVGDTPIGGYSLEGEDGNLVSRSFPDDLNTSTWTRALFTSGLKVNFKKAGETGSNDANIEVKIYKMPVTSI